MTKQLVCSDDSEPATVQHTRPCSDCPFSRKAINGWLGSLSADDWVKAAHGETYIECHVHTGVDCAGAAIYRANICKRLRDPNALRLQADKVSVFANPMEFLEHHTS